MSTEQERIEAHRATVMVWAHRIPAVLASPDATRTLALGVVNELLTTFLDTSRGVDFTASMGLVRNLYEAATLGRVCGVCKGTGAEEGWLDCRRCNGRRLLPVDIEQERDAADYLGSVLYPREPHRWTWQTRIPYEVCEALRRACEDERPLCAGFGSMICGGCGSDGCSPLEPSDPCRRCRGTGHEPVTPPILALLIHDAHALLTDLRADVSGLESLVREAERRERARRKGAEER